ncbi:glucosamine-6-phosphate deaminase [Wenxinia saemankumensis]|uniref:Glucosamine-6-phosphate deaminase n=1 Tax=Wenxinia saemankumensis TaxID=1447782 RepID=A0A1M6HPY1_9RHOB|nr:glucosamine-6-phosphate deaminase [Wenxinia saemankumensis]SHJ24163.1 glucosamine-6-phosphate deaminase [Wenxinia saemankumensis]
MRIVLHDTAEAARAFAVARIAATLAAKPDAVLGLATGGTMEPVYEGLIAAHRDGLSFARATTFNLDEYVGLAGDHPQSYRTYMRHHLFDHVDIAAARTHIPRGDIDPAEAAAAFEAALAASGPVDLQLLGLGHNGHIGFNEPSSSLASRTREKTLTRSTREANARFFGAGETPPHSAVTMGIGTILESRAILVLAVGAAKAGAVRGMVEGPVTARCPASALQMHPDVTVALDAGAAAELELIDHYREAEELRRRREADAA